jgi:hypothetical protein
LFHGLETSGTTVRASFQILAEAHISDSDPMNIAPGVVYHLRAGWIITLGVPFAWPALSFRHASAFKAFSSTPFASPRVQSPQLIIDATPAFFFAALLYCHPPAFVTFATTPLTVQWRILSQLAIITAPTFILAAFLLP